MDEKLKQRLVGAIVLVSLAVIILPMLFDNSVNNSVGVTENLIPERPESEFKSRIIPITPTQVESGQAESIDDVDEDAPEKPHSSTQVSVVEKPAPVNIEKEAVPSAEVRVGLVAWAVQLGSFANPNNAINLRDKLRKMKYQAFVETVYLNKGKKTRVYVGPELKKEKSERVLKKLLKDIDMKGIVVRYPGG